MWNLKIFSRILLLRNLLGIKEILRSAFSPLSGTALCFLSASNLCLPIDDLVNPSALSICVTPVTKKPSIFRIAIRELASVSAWAVHLNLAIGFLQLGGAPSDKRLTVFFSDISVRSYETAARQLEESVEKLQRKWRRALSWDKIDKQREKGGGGDRKHTRVKKFGEGHWSRPRRAMSIWKKWIWVILQNDALLTAVRL